MEAALLRKKKRPPAGVLLVQALSGPPTTVMVEEGATVKEVTGLLREQLGGTIGRREVIRLMMPIGTTRTVFVEGDASSARVAMQSLPTAEGAAWKGSHAKAWRMEMVGSHEGEHAGRQPSGWGSPKGGRGKGGKQSGVGGSWGAQKGWSPAGYQGKGMGKAVWGGAPGVAKGKGGRGFKGGKGTQAQDIPQAGSPRSRSVPVERMDLEESSDLQQGENPVWEAPGVSPLGGEQNREQRQEDQAARGLAALQEGAQLRAEQQPNQGSPQEGEGGPMGQIEGSKQDSPAQVGGGGTAQAISPPPAIQVPPPVLPLQIERRSPGPPRDGPWGAPVRTTARSPGQRGSLDVEFLRRGSVFPQGLQVQRPAEMSLDGGAGRGGQGWRKPLREARPGGKSQGEKTQQQRDKRRAGSSSSAPTGAPSRQGRIERGRMQATDGQQLAQLRLQQEQHRQLQQPPQPTKQQPEQLSQGPMEEKAQLVQDIQESSLFGGGAVSQNRGGLMGPKELEDAVLRGQGEVSTEDATVDQEGLGEQSMTTMELGRQTEEVGDFFAADEGDDLPAGTDVDL